MRVTLGRLAAGAWVAWGVTLGITAWLSLSGVLHANFLYMAVPLGIQLLCTIALVLGGIWRVIRGPRRLWAVEWVLVGMLPTLWMAAYVEFLYHFAGGRSHRRTLVINSSLAMTSLLAEPCVRICHPYRHEGERFVMWSNSPEPNRPVMAAMDKHLGALEKALGERSQYKAYWVRGDVLGIGGRYGVGWVLGSSEQSRGRDLPEDYLESVDRHEMAHFALDELMPPTNQIPMLLHEGWAQYCTGPRLSAEWRWCWSARRRGELRSLRELTSQAMYYDSELPMYHQGALLVDYLLRRFGHAKFVEFCRTCRESTFEEDLRRVFGMGLDELDRAYQEELTRYSSPEQQFLMSLPRADGVDPRAWRRFVDDYLAGLKRLRGAFDRSSVVVAETHEAVDIHGKRSSSQRRQEYFTDGRRRAVRGADEPPGRTGIEISTPDIELIAGREHPDAPWQTWRFNEHPAAASEADAPTLSEVSRRPYLELVFAPLNWQRDEVGLRITSLGPSPTDARLVRVGYAGGMPEQDASQWIPGWWDVDPRHDYGLAESRLGNVDDDPEKPIFLSRYTVEYQTIDGYAAPRRAVDEWHAAKGLPLRRQTMEIESCRFGPPAAEVFKPGTYGTFAPAVSTPWQPREPFVPPRIGLWLAGGDTLLAIVIGSGLAIASFCRRRRTASSPDGAL
jgi:hypothetical protein